MQKTSERGRELIKQFEGKRNIAYRDVAGIWTIGYGHTGPEIAKGMKITDARADALLELDLARFEQGVSRLVGPCDQAYFDALVSLAYNIGLKSFAGSSVLRWHKRGDEEKAAQSFALWCKARVGGKLTVVPGLVRRRAAEASMYREGDFANVTQARPIAMAPLTEKQVELGLEAIPESALVPEKPGSLPDLATSGRIIRPTIGAPAAGGLAYTAIEAVNGNADQAAQVDAVQGQLQHADTVGQAVDPGVVAAKLEQAKEVAVQHHDLIAGLDWKLVAIVLAAIVFGVFIHAIYAGYTARTGDR